VIQHSNERRVDREIKLRLAIFPAGIAVDVLAYTPEEVERVWKSEIFYKKVLSKGKILYAK